MIYVQGLSQLYEANDYLKQFNVFSIDTETGGLFPKSCGLKLIQIHPFGGDTVIINYTKIRYSEPSLMSLKWLFTNGDVLRYCHNLAFDGAFIKHYTGITLDFTIDTMLLEEKILGHRYGTGLAACVQKYLNIDISANKKEYQTSFIHENIDGQLPQDFSKEQLEYAARDVTMLPLIFKEQWTELHQLYARPDLILVDCYEQAIKEMESKYLATGN